MRYRVSYHTDRGIKKQTNQDALAVKIADTEVGRVAMGIVCDGMGGLSKGELASKTLIESFSRWFDQELPSILQRENLKDALENSWREIVERDNKRLLHEGKMKGDRLGTTLTVFLGLGESFYGYHVGDSRLYQIRDRVSQVTKDQTLVQLEMDRGNLTETQAKLDPRRNVLLQCVGAAERVTPVFHTGELIPDCTYLLCTDGFRHQITLEEMYETFRPEALTDEEEMKNRSIQAVELVKGRMEEDNISVLVLRTY